MPDRIDVGMVQVWRVATHLPDGWSLRLDAYNDEGYISLMDPGDQSVDFEREGTALEKLQKAVDVARAQEGWPPVAWDAWAKASEGGA